jgi:hypothetical protein
MYRREFCRLGLWSFPSCMSKMRRKGKTSAKLKLLEWVTPIWDSYFVENGHSRSAASIYILSLKWRESLLPRHDVQNIIVGDGQWVTFSIQCPSSCLIYMYMHVICCIRRLFHWHLCHSLSQHSYSDWTHESTIFPQHTSVDTQQSWKNIYIPQLELQHQCRAPSSARGTFAILWGEHFPIREFNSNLSDPKDGLNEPLISR